MPRVSIDLTDTQRRALDKLASVYACDIRELAGVAVAEMLAAHRHQRPARKVRQPRPRHRVVSRRRVAAPVPAPPPAAAVAPLPSTAARTYQPKPCAACGKPFAPTGPNAKVCLGCKASFDADKGTPAQLETVWNGTKGRQGASLTSH